MSALSNRVQSFIAWLSPQGRINRSAFLRSYMLPVVLLIVLTAVTSVPGLLYICFWIFVAGTTKRLHDVNLKFGRGAKWGVGVVWFMTIIVAAAIGLVFFLGGISGPGNSGMIRDAALIVAAPIVLPIPVIVLIAILAPGSPVANEHGSVPVSSETSAAARRNTKAVLRVALVAAAILITGAAFFASYIYLSEREPPLMQALKDMDANKVKTLLIKGEDPNKSAGPGMTPLMTALSAGWDESAMLLLEYGADPNVNSVNSQHYGYVDFKQTPLVAAIRYTSRDSAALIELMLETGANVNPLPASEHEKTPLLEAIAGQRYDVVELLLARGADLRAPSNQEALAVAVNLIDDRFTELLLAGDIDQQQIESVIQWIESSLVSDGCQRFLPTKREKLIAAVNKRAGTEVYALSEYFIPASEVYDPMNFTKHDFKRPIAAITNQWRLNPRFVRAGPGMEYDKVTSLLRDSPVEVVAMTDSSKFGYRWFQIRYGNDQTGYMLGDALRSKTICIEGMDQL